jgi:hypothetical protein
MTRGLRKVQPLAMPQAKRATLRGKRPELKWVAPTDLLVDGTYQRDLSERSIRLITRMIECFAWNRMKPPIVTRVAGGFHVIDGQHTAIAAASMGVPEIPIFIVEAESLDERARAFVGHNTDRIVVSPFDIYRALLSSGDPSARAVDEVCQAAGIRIRRIQPNSLVAEGDTAAIGRVQALVKKRGPQKAIVLLKALVKAKLAPVGSPEILAADYLLFEDGVIDAETLSRIIRIDGAEGIAQAHAASKLTKTPIWRVLAEKWLKKRKQAA